MTVAPVYNRQFNFSNFQMLSPAAPLPATPLDSEFSSVKVTLDALNANLQLIQRSDGFLANASVGPQQLQPSILAGMSPPTQWSGSSVSYQVGATVFSGLLFYVANTANISSAGNPPATYAAWTLLADFSGVTIQPGSVTSASFAPKAVNSAALGDNLALPQSPTTGDNSTAIATTAFVNSEIGVSITNYKNRVINGSMRVDQRNSGASGTATGYTCDRWRYGATQTSKATWQRTAGGPPVAPNCLTVTSNASPYSLLTTDSFQLQTTIEAGDLIDLLWGGSSAQAVQLSFWVQSNATGTFGGSIRNGATNRSYPFSYAISVVNTWTPITISIPGDTSGAWASSVALNAAGMIISFSLGAGATFQGVINSWQAGNFTSVAGATQVVGQSNAFLILTGVALTLGAAPFELRSYGTEIGLCQRYYELQLNDSISCNVTNAGAYAKYTPFVASKRIATPTMAYTVTANSNFSAAASTGAVSATGIRWLGTASATGTGQLVVNWTADADF